MVEDKIFYRQIDEHAQGSTRSRPRREIRWGWESIIENFEKIVEIDANIWVVEQLWVVWVIVRPYPSSESQVLQFISHNNRFPTFLSVINRLSTIELPCTHVSMLHYARTVVDSRFQHGFHNLNLVFRPDAAGFWSIPPSRSNQHLRIMLGSDFYNRRASLNFLAFFLPRCPDSTIYLHRLVSRLE